MPTVLVVGAARFVIYVNDHGEPHVHMVYHGERAKVLLNGTVVTNTGIPPMTLGRLVRVLKKRREELLAAWEEYHGEEEIHSRDE